MRYEISYNFFQSLKRFKEARGYVSTVTSTIQLDVCDHRDLFQLTFKCIEGNKDQIYARDHVSTHSY